MLLPNAERAIIGPAKLHGYLLSPSHPVGRFKARFFSALGFTADDWGVLEAALRAQHLTRDAEPGLVEPHGRFYTIRANLEGPAGASAVIACGWYAPAKIVLGS